MARWVFAGPIIAIILLAVAIPLFSESRLLLLLFGLLAAMVAVLPFVVSRHASAEREREVEDQLPAMLLALSEETRRSTLPAALRKVAKADWGPLTDEFRQLANQLSWGQPLPAALKRWANKTEYECVSRVALILHEVFAGGGDIPRALTALANNMVYIQEAERAERGVRNSHAATMYIMFTAELALSLLLLEMLTSAGAPAFPNQCVVQSSACSILTSVASFFALGSGANGFFGSLILLLILTAALRTGLLIGQVTEDRLAPGLLYVLLMGSVGFTAVIAVASGVI